MAVSQKNLADYVDVDVGEGLSLAVDLVSTFVDLQLADAEDDAASEFIEFPEEGVNLSDFIVVLDEVLQGVLQFRFLPLLLPLDIHLDLFDDASLLLVEFVSGAAVLGDGRQVDVEILFAVEVRNWFVSVEQFEFGLDDKTFIILDICLRLYVVHFELPTAFLSLLILLVQTLRSIFIKLLRKSIPNAFVLFFLERTMQHSSVWLLDLRERHVALFAPGFPR